MGGLTCGGELAMGGGGFVAKVIIEFKNEMQATSLDIHVSISL